MNRGGGGGSGIGGAVAGSTLNSVLFVNPAGTLAEDNANFFYSTAGGLVANKFSTIASGTLTIQYGAAANDTVGVSSTALFGQSNAGGVKFQFLPLGAAGVVGRFASDAQIGFNSTTNLSGGAIDTTLGRNGVGIVQLAGISNVAAEYQVSAGNGGFISNVKSVTESLTIAAAATTVGATSIPAGAILLGVSVRVTTVIPTAATFTYATTVGATALSTAAVAVAAGSTDPGTAAGASFRAAATTITITPNLTPGAATGVVRLHYYYLQVTPPTS